MPRLLILDDEPNVIAALRRLIRQHYKSNLEVMAFVDPAEALARVKDTAFNVVMSDFRMPVMTGLAFLEQVKSAQPHAVRMILSASCDFDVIQKAVNDVEVFRYMAKPWSEQELLNQLQAGLDKSALGLQERTLADAMRLQQGAMSPADLELKRLEEQEPGITVVDWGPNGEVIMPDGLLDSDIEPQTRRS